MIKRPQAVPNRRKAMTLLGAVGACFSLDIRTDPTTGVVQGGVPLTLAIAVINSNASCAPLAGAYLEIWHCFGRRSKQPALLRIQSN